MARRGRHVQPRRRRGPVLAAGGLAAVVALAAFAVDAVRDGRDPGLGVGPRGALEAGAVAPLSVVPSPGDDDAVTPAAPSATTSARTSASARSRERDVRRAVAATLRDRRGIVDVAITDVGGRQVVHAGSGRPVRTASIVKLLVLRALQARGSVTRTERILATRMITRSDNAATTRLWRAAGRNPAVARAAKAAGMTRTTQIRTKLMLWDGWQTTAEDQVRLLRSISRGRSADDRWTRSLMARVIASQDWGVGAVPGATGVKNGWLPVEGGWIVNSDGCVKKGRRVLCVSVLSTGSRSFTTGIRTVERAAKAAVRAWG
jgi:hypothetical protein